MADDAWEPVADAAQATLDEIELVIPEVKRIIRERVPEYTKVSDEQLTAALTRNLRDLLTCLRDHRQLSPTELHDFTATVEERARNGVPIDEYLFAVGIAEQEVWEQLWRRASAVPEPQLLAAFALRFANVNAITRVTASAHRRIELASARADQERRGDALRMLLRGALQPDDAREYLARLGLAAGRLYYVVRARERGRVDADHLSTSLLPGRAHPPYAALVLWGEDSVGLSRERPVEASGITAGIAGPVSVADLALAHQHASTAFETAWALGLEGTHDLASLGIRAAVQASPEVGRMLRERYLFPLLVSGSLGQELLTTIRAYLQSGSRREAAAARLHVHQNTVTYRLSRFCELTGADLSDLATLAELHWLFIDLELRPET